MEYQHELTKTGNLGAKRRGPEFMQLINKRAKAIKKACSGKPEKLPPLPPLLLIK